MINVQRLFTDLHAWSRKSFGDQRLDGVLAHLKKEVKELCASPDDLEEYADVQLLLFDAAAQKFSKCKGRKWVKQPDGSYRHVPAKQKKAA